MSLTIVGVAHAETGSGTSVTVTPPSGTRAGDVACWMVSANSAAGTLSPPAEWSTVGDVNFAGPPSVGRAQVVLLADPVPSSWVFSVSGGATVVGAVVVVVRGALGYETDWSGIGGNLVSGNTGSTGTIVTASGTTTTLTDGALLVGIVQSNATSGTWTTPSNPGAWTVDFDSGSTKSMAAAHYLTGVAGATGTMTWTESTSGNRKMLAVFALAPDPNYVDPGVTVERGDALDIDLGERLDVTTPPAWLPPDTVRQTVQGTTETLTNFGYSIGFTCTPAAVFDAGVWGASGFRWGSGHSTIGALPAAATTVTVTTDAGAPPWSTTGVPYPVRVRGEVMTVTAVTGATSPQTFTLARGVNGVTLDHPAGAAIEIDPPSYWGL